MNGVNDCLKCIAAHPGCNRCCRKCVNVCERRQRCVIVKAPGKRGEGNMARYGRGLAGQKMLDGMPEPSKLGKECIEYLRLKDEQASVASKLEAQQAVIVEQMLAEGKRAIKIDGRVVSISEKSGFRVTVKESV